MSEGPRRLWHLWPVRALSEITLVLTHGASKYASWGWLDISKEHHYCSAINHLEQWRDPAASNTDSGSGRHTLAHAAARIIFLLALELGDTSPEE